MPKDYPPDLRVIFDTQANAVHFPVESRDWTEPRQLEGIDEFAAYLNTKAGTQRFTVITAAALMVKGRGGLGRHYATFVKGHPALRIRMAINALPDHTLTLTQIHGAWAVPRAMSAIEHIAVQANVPFNEAREALFSYLRQQLGDVMDRAIFPPANAVTNADDTGGAEQPDPIAE